MSILFAKNNTYTWGIENPADSLSKNNAKIGFFFKIQVRRLYIVKIDLESIEHACWRYIRFSYTVTLYIVGFTGRKSLAPNLASKTTIWLAKRFGRDIKDKFLSSLSIVPSKHNGEFYPIIIEEKSDNFDIGY